MAVTEQIKVIDTDTHIIEPADLWTSRVSTKRWGDLVPHVLWDENTQDESWYFGDTRITSTAGNAMAGWHQFPPDHPARIEDVDPALWEPTARLKRMDELGIWAQVLYPNVAGFGTGRLLGLREPELMLECVRAYNDFLSDFSNVAPDRYLAMAALPFWDLEACLIELKRTAENGHRGLVVGSQPEQFGLPRIQDRHWDPLWAAAQDMEMPINFHIASGDISDIAKDVMTASGVTSEPETGGNRHANYAQHGVSFFMGNSLAISRLTTGGVCHRFPRLNFVSVESGVGWIPYCLSALDWQWKNSGVREEHPEYELLPSEYFHRQIYGCFWHEGVTALHALDVLGPDNIMFETDYPHPTCMAPGPATSAVEPWQYIDETFKDVPDDTMRKILHGNAARIYHLD